MRINGYIVNDFYQNNYNLIFCPNNEISSLAPNDDSVHNTLLLCIAIFPSPNFIFPSAVLNEVCLSSSTLGHSRQLVYTGTNILIIHVYNKTVFRVIV